MYNDYYSILQQGWQCPSCGRVYSPWMSECRVCGNAQTYTTTNYTITSDENPTMWAFAEQINKIISQGVDNL